MEAWWFRIAYLAVFIIFFFVFRYLFNRWRRQALEEQANLHNLQLANQAEALERIEAERQRQHEIVIEEPPDFETAVKYSMPVSYIEVEEPPPYDSLAQVISTKDGSDLNEESSPSSTSDAAKPRGELEQDCENHI